MARIDEATDTVELGVASEETRGGFVTGIEPGGLARNLPGLADDD